MKTEELLFELIHIALTGKGCLSVSPSTKKWEELFLIATKQGVTGLGFLAIKKLTMQSQMPPDKVFYQWLAAVAQVGSNYDLVTALANKLSAQFKEAGIKVLEMKGRGLAEYYPDVRLRVFGDLDIYSISEKQRIDELLRAMSVDFDNGFFRHTQCWVDGVMVENHQTITDTKGQRRLARLEVYLSSLAAAHLARQPLGGLYQSEETFLMIHFLYHAQNDFLASRLTMKFLAEWCLLMEHRREMPLAVLSESIKKYDLLQIATYISALCINRLGLRESLLPVCVAENLKNVKPELLQKFEEDVMNSDYLGYPGDTLSERTRRGWHVYKNRWKLSGVLGISVWDYLWGKVRAAM